MFSGTPTPPRSPIPEEERTAGESSQGPVPPAHGTCSRLPSGPAPPASGTSWTPEARCSALRAPPEAQGFLWGSCLFRIEMSLLCPGSTMKPLLLPGGRRMGGRGTLSAAWRSVAETSAVHKPRAHRAARTGPQPRPQVLAATTSTATRWPGRSWLPLLSVPPLPPTPPPPVSPEEPHNSPRGQVLAPAPSCRRKREPGPCLGFR